MLNDYAPFRRQTLTDEQLRDLSTLSPRRVIRDTLSLWGQIAMVIVVAAWVDHWVAYCAAFVLVGNRYYSLYIIGHDGLHRRLFPEQRRNDLWNDVMILGAIGAITRLNRVNHMEHHRTLGHPEDPDRHKYLRDVPARAVGLALEMLGLRYVRQSVANVFLKRDRSRRSDVSGYTGRDLLILAGWQLVLLTVFVGFFGFWAYFVLWWGSVYVFTFCADVLRVFLEHGQTADEAEAVGADHRLVTYEPGWLERALFAPNNMNHHVAHHLWPSIPYYRLADASAALRRVPLASRLIWRDSYWRRLLQARGLRFV